MIRSFSSSGQWRRRSTVEMISAAMSLAVHNHVDKDSMLHPIRPSPPSRYSRSREGSLTNRVSASISGAFAGNHYDAFRLEVSPSYRELFNRDLANALTREAWRIVPVKRRSRRNRRSAEQLELMFN